jgi:WD40 repeat protein
MYGPLFMRSRFWDRSSINGVAFSPDEKRVATASLDKTVRIHTLAKESTPIDIEKLISLAKMRFTRPLTSEECQKYLYADRLSINAMTPPVRLILFTSGGAFV